MTMTTMATAIATFDDLLSAARSQPEPQRLLFVFAEAELPEDCTAEQRAGFEAGEGGALTPVASVDKAPAELSTFAALVDESRQFSREWAVVFVGAMAERNGQSPASEEADRQLQRMIESIKAGSIGGFIPFDRAGQALQLD